MLSYDMSARLLLLLMLFLPSVPSYSGELYKWVDEKGIVHFTDNPQNISDRGKKDIEVQKMPEPKIIEKSKLISVPDKKVKIKKESAENAYGLQKKEIPPDFTLTSLAGRPMSLKDQEGKVVFLNFWATWCGPCRREMPSMEKLYRRMNKNFVMMAISDEKKSKVNNFIKKNKYTFPVLMDDKNISKSKYRVSAIPTTYIIGKDRKILYKVSGGVDWMDPEMLKWFKVITKL